MDNLSEAWPHAMVLRTNGDVETYPEAIERLEVGKKYTGLFKGHTFLEVKQAVVGGYIEYVPLHKGDFRPSGSIGNLIVNEEGLMYSLEPNTLATELLHLIYPHIQPSRILVGDVILEGGGEVFLLLKELKERGVSE